MEVEEKLTEQLYQLFEINQPDLDFGFYKIMHAKSDQIRYFIKNEIFETIKETPFKLN